MSKQLGIDDIVPAELFPEFEPEKKPIELMSWGQLPIAWYDFLTEDEWDYCIAVDWEMWPGGCVVVYE